MALPACVQDAVNTQMSAMVSTVTQTLTTSVSGLGTSGGACAMHCSTAVMKHVLPRFCSPRDGAASRACCEGRIGWPSTR